MAADVETGLGDGDSCALSAGLACCGVDGGGGAGATLAAAVNVGMARAAIWHGVVTLLLVVCLHAGSSCTGPHAGGTGTLRLAQSPRLVTLHGRMMVQPSGLTFLVVLLARARSSAFEMSL